MIYKGSDGQFCVRLVAANGQTVASSEGYTAKASAQSTVDSVKANAGSATVEDQT